VLPKWSRFFVLAVRSNSRPATKGPRSITLARTECPRCRSVSFVPQGIDLWATPRVEGVRVCPQAVRFPYRPGPYHEAVARRYTVTRRARELLPAAIGSPSATARTFARPVSFGSHVCLKRPPLRVLVRSSDPGRLIFTGRPAPAGSTRPLSRTR